MSTKNANARREDDPQGLIKQRREQIKKNREADTKGYFEQELADYCEGMRRLFKQGFITWAFVSGDLSNHERFAKGWQDSEKLGEMKAAYLREQAAKRVTPAKKSRAA